MSMNEKRQMVASSEAEERRGGAGAPGYLAGNVDSEIDKITDLRNSILGKGKCSAPDMTDKFQNKKDERTSYNNRADGVRDYEFITATDKYDTDPAGKLVDPRNMLAFHRVLEEQAMATAYLLTGPGTAGGLPKSEWDRMWKNGPDGRVDPSVNAGFKNISIALKEEGKIAKDLKDIESEEAAEQGS